MTTASCDVLVLGAAGQLGHDVVATARAKGLRVTGLRHDDVDITDTIGLRRAFARHRPNAVINCAAFHNVEGCEREPARADAVNHQGARKVAAACLETGAQMAHISTDYVFDGARPPPTNGRPTPATAYIPEDLARPLGAYGRTKLLGEDAVLAQDPHHLVVRVASLFGHAGARQKGGNFVDKILARAASGQAIEVVDDQWMTPTSTLDASHGILALVDEGATGRHHVTSGGACTWWDLADAACRARGIDTPVGRRRMEVPSLRPRNSALVAHEAAGWQQALRTYVRETSSGA